MIPFSFLLVYIMEVPEPDTGGAASKEQQFSKQLLISSENIVRFCFVLFFDLLWRA